MKENNHYLERASYDWSKDSIRLILTPSKTAKSIYFYLQECGYFKTKPPYFTERKNLNSFLLVYTIAGQGILRYQNQQYTLTSGKCFFIHCMDYHFYKTSPTNSWEFLWIHFNGMNALGFYKEFLKSGFQILNIKDTFFFERTMRRIVSINRKKDVTTELVTSNLITNLLTELLLQNSLQEADIIYIPELIKSLMHYIDKNYSIALSLDFLADEFHISKFHLSKEFKKYTGFTIGEYILNTRLSFAKELLKYSTLPVSEIAQRSGIYHVSHFIHLFKENEGMTPLAFRKEWHL